MRKTSVSQLPAVLLILKKNGQKKSKSVNFYALVATTNNITQKQYVAHLNGTGVGVDVWTVNKQLPTTTE